MVHYHQKKSLKIGFLLKKLALINPLLLTPTASPNPVSFQRASAVSHNNAEDDQQHTEDM
ncbi:MAG: hypothetical protein RLZZ338_2438 [Cyanobacteriota bacterium]